MWKETKLSILGDVKGGKRLPKGSFLIDEKNSHPYIRVRDLTTKTLELTDEYQYVDDETQKTISRYTVNKNDVIISVVGTVGLVAKIGKSLDGANLTENCNKIINLRGITSDYLYYYLSSEIGKAEISKGIVGAVQPKLPLKNIQNFVIRYPDITVQTRITDILSRIDSKIDLNNRINNNLAY